MIEGFDIGNFGSFKDFQWNAVRDHGNNIAKFKKLNLLYGRNCSGKTTLSRILRCLETGEIPQNYDSPVFSVQTAGMAITQADIPSAKHAIRVYNKDFVQKHLGFLRHDDGTIEPFATIGQENKGAEEKIAAKTAQMGTVDTQVGLLHEREQARLASEQAQQAASTAEQALDALLIKKATNSPDGMKYRPKFGDINYNKTKLRADIQTAKVNQPLSDDVALELETLVGESALPNVSARLGFAASLPFIYAKTKDILTRKIQPTKPIQQLLNDAVLQAWVRDGMQHHRDKRSTCGFCRQPLPADLWEELNAHFNKQSVDLDADVSAQLRALETEEAAVDTIGRVEPSTVMWPFVIGSRRSGPNSTMKLQSIELA